MDIRIREATPDDAAAIVGILNPIIEAGAYTVLDGPLSIEDERQYITCFPQRGVFHVAVSPEGSLVGFQSVEPFASYARAFDHVATIGTYVQLEQRRQGIGSRLAAATFEAARGRGFEKLFTYVRADSSGSLAFYLRLGFRVVGTAQRQARIGEAYVDEIIIEHFL